MAMVQRQHVLVGMLWLTFIALGRCRNLKGDKVLKSQTTNSSAASIERLPYYGHLTIGVNMSNPINYGKPSANSNTEMFGGSFEDEADYQSDTYSHVVTEPERLAEGVFSQGIKRTPAVDRLLGMKPMVECAEDSMTLKLHGATSLGFPFLVDRGNSQPLSLSKMPPVCGYSVRKNWGNLVFSTPYDGCDVAQEESVYVLPLLICGLPVRMACPSMAPKLPSVSCHIRGMTVKIESPASVKDINIKVNSKWESLMKVSSQCGFSVVEHPEGVIISAPYFPCIGKQDGLLTLEVAAEGDFKISCPSQPSDIHVKVTACPETSSTTCLATPLADSQKPTQTPQQSISRPPEQPKFPINQIPNYVVPEPEHSGVPQHPRTQVPQATRAPLDPVYPKKPTPVEDPSKSMPPHIPEPVQSPAQLPFYIVHPGYYPQHPHPVTDAQSPQHKHSGVPQQPQKQVPQATQAPLYPVYPKKPTPVENPSKSMPPHIPEPVQSLDKFPFYSFHPGFYPQHPKPATAAPSPQPEHSGVPQQPQKPVPQSTQAPLYPVYPKKPTPVEDPSKSMPPHIPEPVQSPAQLPFYIVHPGYYPQHPHPVTAAPSPQPEHSGVPQQPQKPVPQATQAPLYPVYPKKPTPVEDPSKSMSPHIPEPVQSPAQLPFYIVHPGYYPQHPHPVTAAQSPQPEHSGVPQHPQKQVPQATQAPLDPVYPKKPTPVEDPSKSTPPHIPEPVQSLDKFPFYSFHPGFYPQHPKPATAAPSPQPEHSGVPQQPQKPVPQSTQAPLYPVYPKKPTPVEDPSKSMSPHIPEPVQSPAQLPFYIVHPGYYPQHPHPVTAAQSPQSEHSGVPQHPQKEVPQATQAPLDPVYPKKPTPVEDPSKSMPPHIPEPVQSPAQFPFYIVHPGFYPQHPKPATAAPSPQPEHSGVPQQPQKPVPQSTQAPLYPVYPKKPTPVEDPSKSMSPHIPEPVQSPAQLPFYIVHPGYYPQHPHPVTAAQSPQSEHSGVPQHPQKEVPQATQAPLDPVYPKKPTPVEDPSKSMPPHIPEPVQSPAQLPFYIVHPGFYPQHPKPATAAPSPQPEHSGVPQQTQKPVPQSTQAPLYPVYPKKPTPVEDPSKSMSPHIPEPVQSPAQLPFYIVHPGYYPQHPHPVTAAQSPQSEHSGVPQHPQKEVPQATQAPLDPVYPKKPTPVEDPSKSTPPHIPEPVQSPAQLPFYIVHPGYYPQHPHPVTAAQSPQPERSGVPQHPQKRVPQATQAPLYPKKVPPAEPAHLPYIPDPHPVPQRPSLVPTAPDAPDGVIYQPTHCSIVCMVAYSNCCPPVLSFHRHHHHHNHFFPSLGQMVQPAPATGGKEPSYFQRVLSHSLMNNRNKLPNLFLNATQETSLTPFLQRGSYQEQDAQHMPMFNSDPTVKLTLTPTNQSQYPSWNSYLNILANGHHSKHPSISYSVQLTQQPASEQPNTQPLEHPYDLPAPESNLHDVITNNAKGMSSKTAKSPGLHNNVQVAKDHILKPQGTVRDPAPYPWFQAPYFVPYPPPTSKPNTHPEALTSPPYSPLSSVLNAEAPSSKFYLMSTPPVSKSPKHFDPHPWVQHPFPPPSVLRPNMWQQVQNTAGFSSDSPQVHHAPSKQSTLKLPVVPSGSGSEKPYRHQVVPAKATAGKGYPKMPFSSESSKPHPQHVVPSKKTSSQHINSGPKDESLASTQFKDYWKLVRPHHV